MIWPKILQQPLDGFSAFLIAKSQLKMYFQKVTCLWLLWGLFCWDFPHFNVTIGPTEFHKLFFKWRSRHKWIYSRWPTYFPRLLSGSNRMILSLLYLIRCILNLRWIFFFQFQSRGNDSSFPIEWVWRTLVS